MSHKGLRLSISVAAMAVSPTELRAASVRQALSTQWIASADQVKIARSALPHQQNITFIDSTVEHDPLRVAQAGPADRQAGV